MATMGESRRIDVLSHPKPIPSDFREDRRSVYWIDRYPPQSGPDGTTAFAMGPRLEQLCLPKSSHLRYTGDRPTPIWPVSDGAKSANASARVSSLAEPRQVHRNYQHRRSVYTEVSPEAQSAEPSERLTQLSLPKPHKIWSNNEDTYREGDPYHPILRIPPSALRARASARVEVLAEAKQEHSMYQSEKPVRWPVSETARNATATLRLQQLARAKEGKTINDDYDPYKVSAGARTARPTNRVCELATPIPRKIRQKRA